jgi:hypothetical protein
VAKVTKVCKPDTTVLKNLSYLMKVKTGKRRRKRTITYKEPDDEG